MNLDTVLGALRQQGRAELKAIAAKVAELLAEQHCAACGKAMTQRHRTKRYCDDACRQGAHRARHAVAADPVIRTLTLGQARPFILRWHYSGKVPTGKNIHFGWYVGRKLYAVATYGDGVNAVQAASLAKQTGKPVTAANLYELRRLCRVEPAARSMPLTKFIAGCHRILRVDHGIRFVVSFSDPAHNHKGGIYRAANFQHLGKTDAEHHVVDADGQHRHRRVAYRHKERANAKRFSAWLKRKGWKAKPPYVAWPAGAMTMAEARKALGLTQAKTAAKDRWLLAL